VGEHLPHPLDVFVRRGEFHLDLSVIQSQIVQRSGVQRHSEQPVRQSYLTDTATGRPPVLRHQAMAVETEGHVLAGRFADVAREQQEEALALFVLGDTGPHYVVVRVGLCRHHTSGEPVCHDGVPAGRRRLP
jgi:hypothetical protein